MPLKQKVAFINVGQLLFSKNLLNPVRNFGSNAVRSFENTEFIQRRLVVLRIVGTSNGVKSFYLT